MKKILFHPVFIVVFIFFCAIFVKKYNEPTKLDLFCDKLEAFGIPFEKNGNNPIIYYMEYHSKNGENETNIETINSIAKSVGMKMLVAQEGTGGKIEDNNIVHYISGADIYLMSIDTRDRNLHNWPGYSIYMDSIGSIFDSLSFQILCNIHGNPPNLKPTLKDKLAFIDSVNVNVQSVYCQIAIPISKEISKFDIDIDETRNRFMKGKYKFQGEGFDLLLVRCGAVHGRLAFRLNGDIAINAVEPKHFLDAQWKSYLSLYFQ